MPPSIKIPNTPEPTDLKRLNQRLLSYWNSLRQNRMYPAESDLNPDDLHDIWDHCFLVSLDGAHEKQGFRYSYLGDALVKTYDDEKFYGDIRNRLVSPNGAVIKQHFEDVIAEKIPLIYDTSFIDSHKLDIRYRFCLLPLGDASADTITHILGCMRWKAY